MKPLPRARERCIRDGLGGESTSAKQTLADVMDAMTYWRERNSVTAEDVAREGVTPAKRTAYLRTVATEDRAKYRDHVAWTLPLGGQQSLDLTVHREPIADDYQDRVTARVVADVARGLGLSPWAVLDAMAEVEP